MDSRNIDIIKNLLDGNNWGEWLTDTYSESNISFYPFLLRKDEVFPEIIKQIVRNCDTVLLADLKRQTGNLLSNVGFNKNLDNYDLTEVLYLSKIIFGKDIFTAVRRLSDSLDSCIPCTKEITPDNIYEIEVLLKLISEWLFIYQKETLVSQNNIYINNRILIASFYGVSKIFNTFEDCKSSA